MSKNKNTQEAVMEQPEEFDLRSHHIVADKTSELLKLFPEIRTEGGKVDFDKLRLLLGETVDVGRERYGMNWPGKAECFKTIQAPSLGTLLPERAKSINFDATENLIIEGDNLEVLKLLQKSYLGKIKMIYIDPPYNTGNDFIYPDNYAESLHTYLEYTSQVDGDGRRFGTNTEADGRFHSKWINMMYPRLYLARNLLREDGIIFISIDEHESCNLKKLCDEIFGEENFCSQFVWHTEGNTDNQYAVKVVHEYILAYYKSYDHAESTIGHVVDPNTPEASNLWKGIADNNINKNSPANPPDVIELPVGFPCAERTLFYAKKELDENFFKVTRSEKYISEEVQRQYGIEKKSGLPVKLDDLVVDNFRLTQPCRIYGGFANRNKLIQFIANGCAPIEDEGTPLRFYLNTNAAVRYQRTNDKPRNILSVLRGHGTTEKTKTYLKTIGVSYDYPKPVGLLQYLLKVGCECDGIVLDFFAGSGTIAEATFLESLARQRKLNFILVQLPEPHPHKENVSLADICRNRVTKVATQLLASHSGELPFEGEQAPDLGFRFYKLSQSNFSAWNAEAVHEESQLARQLELHVDHIREDRTSEDILSELLLKSGYPITTPVELVALAGKHAYSIAGGAFVICLENELTLDLIRAIATLQPERVVCLDEGFAGNDQLKANAVQTFKTKGVISFRTV